LIARHDRVGDLLELSKLDGLIEFAQRRGRCLA
jgi:hypothetical protein